MVFSARHVFSAHRVFLTRRERGRDGSRAPAHDDVGRRDIGRDDSGRDGPAAPRAYRPELDGLRAIAVLAVVLTHLQTPGFGGGFLGVDVFFVISGFLIYGDLSARLRRGTFSTLAFYGRRLRRTLPALYLVLACSLAAALVLLWPGDLVAMARGLVATLLLVPNILFLTRGGYFDPSAAMNPLLHTWSLGVEEQFYLLCPLLPRLLLRRSDRARVALLLAAFGLSLGVCIAAWTADPAVAFYLMPTRIWEFVAGCLLAERALPRWHRRWQSEGAASIGLLLLLASIGLFSDATPHPGLPTLVPVLATAAIIHATGTHATFVGRLLGHRLPAFFGLISYSLYLWHWPAIVFARMADIALTPTVQTVALVGLVGLSTLSWRFVETPFRAAGAACRRHAPALVGTGAAILLASGVGVVVTRGLPQRLPAQVAAIADFYDYADVAPFREGTCFLTSRQIIPHFDAKTCLALDPGRKNVLLIGDSHAAHLWSGLHDTWPGIAVLQANASGCKPVLRPTGAARCTALMDDVFGRFLPAHHVDAIILAALWEPSDVPALRETLAGLRPHADKVYVIGPMPRYDEPLSTLLAESLLAHDPALLATHRLKGTGALDASIEAVVAPWATYVSVYRALCPNDACLTVAAKDVPLQFDYHHLTKPGADLLMRRLRDSGALTF